MLFKQRFHPGLRDGSISVTFRAWLRPQVKVGGRYRFGSTGLLEVESLARVDTARITAADVRRSGFASRADLEKELRRGGRLPATVFRIDLRYVGEEAPPDFDREEEMSADELEEMRARLERMDRLSGHGPFTRQVLELIDRHPRRRAAELAREVGLELQVFKVDVRKLKRLGLTISHGVGYELSPRGRQLLEQLSS